MGEEQKEADFTEIKVTLREIDRQTDSWKQRKS